MLTSLTTRAVEAEKSLANAQPICVRSSLQRDLTETPALLTECYIVGITGL